MSILTEKLLAGQLGHGDTSVDPPLLEQAWREWEWEAADGPLTHNAPTRRCTCYRCGMGPLEGVLLHRAGGMLTCGRHPPKHRMV